MESLAGRRSVGSYGFRHRVVKADSVDGDAASSSQFWTCSVPSEDGTGAQSGSQRKLDKNGSEVFVERVTQSSVQNALHGDDADTESGGGAPVSAECIAANTPLSHNVIRTERHAA